MVYGWFEDMSVGDTQTFGEYLVEEEEMVAFS